MDNLEATYLLGIGVEIYALEIRSGGNIYRRYFKDTEGKIRYRISYSDNWSRLYTFLDPLNLDFANGIIGTREDFESYLMLQELKR